MLSVWVDDVMMKVREARPGGTFVFRGAGRRLGRSDFLVSRGCDVWELMGG